MAHRYRGDPEYGAVREVVDSDEADRYEAYLAAEFERMTPAARAQWIGTNREERLAAAREDPVTIEPDEAYL